MSRHPKVSGGYRSYIGWLFCDYYGVRAWVVFAGVLAAITAAAAAFIAGGIFLIVNAERNWAEKSCQSHSEQLDREVRFVNHHFFDWGCYVQTDDGWVDVDNVRKVEK